MRATLLWQVLNPYRFVRSLTHEVVQDWSSSLNVGGHDLSLWVMLKIMKPAKNSTSGTFILLWHVLHWAIEAPIRKNEAGASKWVFIFHVS